MKKAIFTVTNDLFTDQRVNKMAQSLSKMGFRVYLYGVMRPDSKPFAPPWASIKRVRQLFQKGFLFYAEYNIRLFFYLLFSPFDLVIANDLDSLPAARLAAWCKRKKLVYDTHEYFTGTPEVISRPLVFRIWKALERGLFPRHTPVIAVNKSIASLYEEEYSIRGIHVVRNLPLFREAVKSASRRELDLPEGKHIILLQGSGINVDRGAEELAEAMHPDYGLKDVLLLIIGGGNAIESVKSIANKPELKSRIRFMEKMPYDKLFQYTVHADIGVSIDKDSGLNYRFSLPNKLFDYMMAGVPVLISPLPELMLILEQYQTGKSIKNHDPAHIAKCLKEMLNDTGQMKAWKENCLIAAKELCWEHEEGIVKGIYQTFLDA
jgi:glycosyltransferase involved in cell wall biosynthesis